MIYALFFFLIAAINPCILFAFYLHSICIRWTQLFMHPQAPQAANVHQRFSVLFPFSFVPYSFSPLYPLQAPEKLTSTERPILGRYKPISAVLVVRPIFFRVRIRSLSVLILFSSTHDSYIYACVCDPVILGLPVESYTNRIILGQMGSR